MSLNAIINQDYLPEIEGLLKLLEQYMSRWRGALTLEAQLLVEADAVATFERLLHTQYYMQEVLEGVHPDFSEITQVYGDIRTLLDITDAKLQRLVRMFLTRFNSQQMVLMELIGLMKRIRQKRAVLTFWTRDKARYVLAEHFLNFDNIDSQFSSLSPCDVETNQGVTTLPIRSRTAIYPFKAAIASGSNGKPGNSDEAVQINNSNPESVFSVDSTNWFEYERLDSGPVDLVLNIELGNSEIVNHIAIEPASLGLSLSFEIIDMTFSLSGGSEISIHDLVSPDFDKDFFVVSSAGINTQWALSFLPVEAVGIAIHMRQRQPYQITAESIDNRTVSRDRYAIGIKSIELYRHQYESTGGINSVVLDLPTSYYLASTEGDYWPKDSSLFTSQVEVTTDSGQTWGVVDDSLDGGITLMDGSERVFAWRLSLTRHDDSFQNVTSFMETTNPILDTKSLLRSVNRFQSPIEISLPETPLDQKVFALQPAIATRGDKFNGLRIGEGNGYKTIFTIPFSIIKNDLKVSEVTVYVDGTLFPQGADNATIPVGEWTFSDDYREVIFGAAPASGSEITLVLTEELLVLEERSDGYYAKTKLLFDPDKENISVKYLTRAPERSTVILPRNKTIIDLGVTNILSDSLTLSSDIGTTYTEVSTRAEVLDTPASEFYVDYVNGILYLDDFPSDNILRASFLHQSEHSLTEDDYSIVIEDNVPWGIRIKKNSFQGISFSDRIGAQPRRRIGILTGEYSRIPDRFGVTSSAKTLSQDCIVKGTLRVTDGLLGTTAPPEEVTYIDGKTEFLGLIPMESESTVETAINTGLNSVQFSLSAGALVYRDYDILFTNALVFNNKVSSLAAVTSGIEGDYYISVTGIVTVNVDVGGVLSADIGINYYYRDPSFDPANKYSVNYSEGDIYSHTPMVDDEEVFYVASCYKMGYDVSRSIDKFEYNSETNSVGIRVENLWKINNLVKVIWTEAPPASDLVALREFFSPHIYVVAHRFN